VFVTGVTTYYGAKDRKVLSISVLWPESGSFTGLSFENYKGTPAAPVAR